MIYRALLLVATVAITLVTVPTFAATYFADDFENASDSTTFLGNSSLGGDPNGDADPNGPQAGAWDVITEPQPWKIQVTQANTGGGPANPGPGPASGVNSLGFDRFGGGIEARGVFNTPATGLVTAEFDMWINYGEIQFFPRNATGGGYSDLPFWVDFTKTGQVRVNGTGGLSAPFYVTHPATADPNYNHVEVQIDLTAQTFSVYVDGATLPSLVNRSFVEPATQLQQIIFGEPTGEGAFYIDNVSVQGVPEPTTAALFLLACSGMLVFGPRRARS